jgi:hypothetical protein
MPKTWRVPDGDRPICPDCQSDLSFVGSWAARGLWGYDEVRAYECPTHGPIFFNSQKSIGPGPVNVPDQSPDNSDRDSLVSAPRKPTPTLSSGAIAIPEPDSD